MRSISTPWGLSQTITTICPGFIKVTTAEHGGIYLEPVLNARVPSDLRADDGWYEEDDAAAIPRLSLRQEYVVWARSIGRDPLKVLACDRRSVRRTFPVAAKRYPELLRPGYQRLAERSYDFPSAIIKRTADGRYVEFPKWCLNIHTVRDRDYVTSALRALRRHRQGLPLI